MNNKKYFVELITLAAVLSFALVALPVVADDVKVKPDQPVVTPQCWFICPPDKSSDE